MQDHVEEQCESGGAYKAVTYPICRQAHLLNDERNLLRHYAEQDRLIRGPQRTPVHQQLLRIGLIEEKPVNLRDSVISITDAGRKALGSVS